MYFGVGSGQHRVGVGVGVHGVALSALSIWDTFPELSVQSMTLPRRQFARELCSAVCVKDHATFLSQLASRPELALYKRVCEGPGSRQYLQRSTLAPAGSSGPISAALGHIHVASARQSL